MSLLYYSLNYSYYQSMQYSEYFVHTMQSGLYKGMGSSDRPPPTHTHPHNG